MSAAAAHPVTYAQKGHFTGKYPLRVAALLLVLALVLAASAGAASVRRTKQAITWAFCGHHYKPCEYGNQAIRVSYCETGGTFSIWARNGQYQGLFQMGSWERATYGHGYNPWAQAAAAFRYFSASGRDWGPWECRP